MVSYLGGLFENLMEGGEDAASTAMVVKVKGEQGGGARWQADRQTDQGSVQIQDHGVQTHTHTQIQAGGAFKPLSFSCYVSVQDSTVALDGSACGGVLGNGGDRRSCRCS